MQQRQELFVLGAAGEPDALEHLVLAGQLNQPVLLGPVTGDRQRGSGMGPADPGQGGDQLVDTLLILKSAEVQQFGRAGMWLAGRERPTGGVDSVWNNSDLG